MTTGALDDFTHALRRDEEMATGLLAAVAGKMEHEAAEVFAAYARERGYAVTREDAEALFAAARNHGSPQASGSAPSASPSACGG